MAFDKSGFGYWPHWGHWSSKWQHRNSASNQIKSNQHLHAVQMQHLHFQIYFFFVSPRCCFIVAFLFILIVIFAKHLSLHFMYERC